MSCNPAHNHSHDDHHHHHGDGHDHSDDITPAIQSSLYQQIDFDRITTFNEAQSGSGTAVVKKTWAERFNEEPQLYSDADEQLLMYIPFTGQTKLHSILIYSPPTPSAPKTIKVFRDRNDLDFSTASDMEPTQTLDVPQAPTGEPQVIELPLQRAKFNATTSVTLFVEENWNSDEEVTQISYLGFNGQFTALNREPVTFMYEAAANPKDHTVIQGLNDGVGSSLPGQ